MLCISLGKHLTGYITHRCHKKEFLLKFARDRREESLSRGDDYRDGKWTESVARRRRVNVGGGEPKGMTMKGSLLEGIPAELPEEIFDAICSTESVRIERIVSRGHASPEGFWYDQERNEFVLVVQGSVGLKLENDDDIVVLKAGDYLNIGAHVRHRVEWTDPTCETIWLSVHY